MIELKNIHKSFKGVPVLKGVDLTMPKGEITVILGPSGSGKTVLLRHIIGLHRPDRGTVTVDGVDLFRLGERELNDFRRRFGMLFQSAALFDSLSVFDNVAFPLVEGARGRARPDIAKIVREKLALVGLDGALDKMPSELSGGMRKRVGLARAIVLSPSIILYDEPTTGLDPVMTLAIDNLILSMQKELRVTSVVISHDIDSAFRVADRIAMIHGGRIVESSAPSDFQRSANPVVRAFLAAGGRGGSRGEGN
ncbi:MAG: ABC transporter ATP-binding protein [Proteobacteria bacterium]|nr:ABC transporter ATP-binding protein [Pseudomonadota bacterium]